ncbi:DapH/DapD/GlmU-related protein [Flavihumibacter petaseus]|uniref:Putative acetyltransferase n=1 Tax=Flavihumibacter petaseus NBRC 106054 TaxID=1220578 RepID=A0A0E9N7A1_9BACT|nr:DapH/DapD/GlmU-related protein [Flavihumibacter petaseus]GAO45225.1 putative acetyltransferase [Flavihumibacter petaseus NBRC 106054]
MDQAPVVLFVYNRPGHTLKTLEALSSCDGIDRTILYIFADGEKEGSDSVSKEAVAQVREVIRRQKWAGKVVIRESPVNKGLARSITEGVSELLDNHGKVIVLEDDIVVSRGFLDFMNNGLKVYEKEEEVMHISGYFYPNNGISGDTFFYNVPLCWGWATWKRAWDKLQLDPVQLKAEIDRNNLWEAFNKFGNEELRRQLDRNISGESNTWFIKWHCSVLLHQGFVLHPSNSLVNNIGFDNTGTHGNLTYRYWHHDLADHVKVEKLPRVESSEAEEVCKRFFYAWNGKNKSASAKQAGSILPRFKEILRNAGRSLFKKVYPEISIFDQSPDWRYVASSITNSAVSPKASLYTPHRVSKALIGHYTYVANNSQITCAEIGKFCSIGPNFICGWGIHPMEGISTSPMFYSTRKQNGTTLSATDKIEERRLVRIGNDVFIGANVTVLDGVTIGDGAVIGAGAVVTRDVPPYGVAVGVPAKVIRYRFEPEKIEQLLQIKWWNQSLDELKNVEKMFWDVDGYIAFIQKQTSEKH